MMPGGSQNFRFSGGAKKKLVEADFGVPVLQPTLYNPLAQWELADASGINLMDRSGNGRNLTLSSAPDSLSPDLRPGKFAFSTQGSSRLQRTDVALALLGAVTVTFRAWRRYEAGTAQAIITLAGPSELENGNATYQLYTDPATGGFVYFAERLAGENITWNSGVIAGMGRWFFGTLRRNASGTVVRIGINQTYTTSPTQLAPTGGQGTSYLTIGNYEAGAAPWRGGLSDLCIWGAELTDAQLIPLYKAAMGVK